MEAKEERVVEEKERAAERDMVVERVAERVAEREEREEKDMGFSAKVMEEEEKAVKVTMDKNHSCRYADHCS